MLTKIIRFLGSKKVIAILVVIAIVVFFVTRRTNGNTSVKTSTAKRGEVVAELILSGEAQADTRAVLSFPGSSYLTSLVVQEGDMVTKGQVLGSIDTTTLAASVRQAQWDLRDAQSTVDRVYDQLKGKEKTESFTEIETRTTAEVMRDKAYENLVKAQKALRDATFRSPIDGVVADVGVKTIGASTQIATTAFEIVDTDSLYFSVEADQTEIGEIDEGSMVELIFDAFDDAPVRGRVQSVSYVPKSNVSETVYEVRVALTDLNGLSGKIRIGMTGDAVFQLEKKDNVIYVDSSFVRTDKDGKFVLKGEKREKTYVQTGIEGEDIIEVTQGLSEGDVVYSE